MDRQRTLSNVTEIVLANPLNYYVTLTTKCNLQCRYCYGKCCDSFGSDFGALEIDYSLPTSINYQLSDLIAFLERDPSPTIVFYGGEPLIEIKMIKRIMDTAKSDRYTIQTNGLLLNQIDPDYVDRLDTILVSIDGDENATDTNRGKGVHRRVVDNLRLIRSRGFEGEIIARMTVPVDTEIDRQVNWLLCNDQFRFTSIHWQMDAMFWQKDFCRTEFENWCNRVYNPGIGRLTKSWIERIERSGEVLRLYPFVAVMRSLLDREQSKLRCGAGWNTFNIQTDGKITPCPVMAGMKDFYLGDLWNSNPSGLKDSVFVKEPCTECSIYSLCGGRCLYANATKLWGRSGFQLVCSTVHNLIASLKRYEPRVRQLIDEGTIAIKDFDYGRYNSCEIIP